MSFGGMLNGLLRDALSPQTMDRVRTGAQNAGSGIETTLNDFLGADNVRKGRDFFTEKQVGGLSGGQMGGIGAALGALFGGGLKGAAQGGAIAVLGGLAYKAYQQYQAEQAGGDPNAAPAPDQLEAMTHPDTERTALRAMIMAAKADGRIDQSEMDTLLGRMGGDAVTPEDRAFVQAEMAKPVDPESLAAEVSRPEVATEVYLAALLAITVDTEAEKDFLRRLGGALGLEPGVTARLHRMTGAPAV